MSVRTMARVWAESKHSGSDLLMLLAIADFADDDGRAYPSVPTLAAKCRMKPRNANYVLSTLKASGELEILVNEGPKGTNLYRVNLELMGLQSSAPLQNLAPLQCSASTPAILGSTPATQCAKPLQRSADEPPRNHQRTTKEPSKRRANSTQSLGDQFPDLLGGVDPQLIADWHSLMKAKKATVTRTLLQARISEGRKAGMTLQQTLAYCCEQSWGGFKADWVKPKAGHLTHNRADQRANITAGLTGARNATPKPIIVDML